MEKIVMVPISDIKPYDKNPRKNDATVNKLVGLIPKVGFDVPLLLDKNNVIVKGHARYEAAKKLGMTEVPCIYTENDDNLNAFDRIADNKVHEFTQWDIEQRDHEIDMIDTDYDLSQLGFNLSSNDNFGFDFSDYEEEEQEDGEEEESYEEKRAKFLEYLKQHEDEVEMPVITTNHDLKSANQTVFDVFRSPDILVEVKCAHCGKTIMVRKDKFIEL